MPRCKLCRIYGDDAASVTRHEKICIAVACADCAGKGGHFAPGCIRPQWYRCRSCEGTGIKGGVIAASLAHEYAILNAKGRRSE